LEERIKGLEARLDDWKAETLRQADKTESAIKDKFDHMNKIREEVITDRVFYLRIDAYDMRHREIEQRLKLMDDFINNLRGRMWAGGLTLTIAMTILTVAISIVVKYF
jgi:hypothetical protein